MKVWNYYSESNLIDPYSYRRLFSGPSWAIDILRAFPPALNWPVLFRLHDFFYSALLPFMSCDLDDATV
jgi:hypothetical protein